MTKRWLFAFSAAVALLVLALEFQGRSGNERQRSDPVLADDDAQPEEAVPTDPSEHTTNADRPETADSRKPSARSMLPSALRMLQELAAADQPAEPEVLLSRHSRVDLQRRWTEAEENEEETEQLAEYIGDAMRDLEVRGELQDASCRAGQCRVQIRFRELDHVLRMSEMAGFQERVNDLQFGAKEGWIVIDALLEGEDGKPL